MAPKYGDAYSQTTLNRGAWTAEEDRKLAEFIEVHGAKRWKAVAAKSGLNRCGKSCRLRWLNYLRPNIKRGNISYEEEDLILRLHKLLGNRWALIAGRLPGRTDNEIKNYWNAHLSKKINNVQREKTAESSTSQKSMSQDSCITAQVMQNGRTEAGKPEVNFDVNQSFDSSSEGIYDLDWINEFLGLDG